jgi:hypothetical protein
MRRTLTVALLLGLVAVLGKLLWSRWGRLGAAEAKLEGRFQTEEQWLVAEVVQDLAEMALYASGGSQAGDAADFAIENLSAGGSPAGYRVSFSLGTKGRYDDTVQVQPHIWSPDAYEGMARGLLAKLELKARPLAGATDREALHELLNLQARVIQTQNERVSARLEGGGMLDPAVHEEAALLVGSLALREAAGYFWDVRQLLCRMAAHLAIARALRGPSPHGPDGMIAAVILRIEAGLTTEALNKLDELEAQAAGSEDMSSWLRALRLLVTRDWRTLPDPWTRTLLERLAYFRAVRETLDLAAAVDFHRKSDDQPIPDWGRVAFQGSLGTEVGVFAGGGIDLEIAEAQDLWARIHGRPLGASSLVQELNRPATRCVTSDRPRVIGWGTWAASLQRHICHRVLELDTYLRTVLGMQAEAHGAIADLDGRFSDLALYPYAQAIRWHHGGIELETLADGLNTGIRTAVRQPELLTAPVWAHSRLAAQYGVVRQGMPNLQPWFAMPVPSGTAYNANRRLTGLQPKGGVALLQTLRERDPWQHGLAQLAIQARGGKATVDEIRREFGAASDYDLWVLDRMVEASGPRSPERERLLEDECRLLADRCIDLAEQRVALARDAEAAEALQRAFDAAYSRVAVANSSTLLVRHYHERGDAEQATRVAEDAAGTGAAGGLETMALLHEWRGELAQAEELFTQIERRYGSADELLGHYHRMAAAGGGEYESRLNRLLPKTFPGGLEAFDAGNLPPTPRDGVRITSRAERWGLGPGDIIVGLDGWRVHNPQQYFAVRSFDDRPELRLHIWQRGRYVETRARCLNRLLGVDLSGYP